MTISVVMCCHNSENRIEAAINSIIYQCDVKDYIQIILVDNNCSDKTVHVATEIAKRHGRALTVVHESTPGLVHARRAGAFAATGTYTCFVDDDNQLDPHYISQAISIFASYPDVGYIGGQSRLPSHYTLPEWLSSSLLLSYAVGHQYFNNDRVNSPTPLLWGAGLCVNTVALQNALRNIDDFKCIGRVGGKQLAGDDSELCYRLAIQGWEGYYDAALTLVHAIDPARFTVQRLLEMYKGFGSAKPTLDALEAELAKKKNRKTNGLRSVLYHPVGRVAAYSILAIFFSIRLPENIARRAKSAYYRAALCSSIRALRADH